MLSISIVVCNQKKSNQKIDGYLTWLAQDKRCTINAINTRGYSTSTDPDEFWVYRWTLGVTRRSTGVQWQRRAHVIHDCYHLGPRVCFIDPCRGLSPVEIIIDTRSDLWDKVCRVRKRHQNFYVERCCSGSGCKQFERNSTDENGRGWSFLRVF